jgi:hypothetical protein
MRARAEPESQSELGFTAVVVHFDLKRPSVPGGTNKIAAAVLEFVLQMHD